MIIVFNEQRLFVLLVYKNLLESWIAFGNSRFKMPWLWCWMQEKENAPKIHECTKKNVKDVGLDPTEDEFRGLTSWPVEFKRLQRQIIELWHACNVSLVHRTYFFLLFQGDPSDAIYLEVEIRRMKLLKDKFSRGDKIIVDGQRLTLSSRWDYHKTTTLIMFHLCRFRESDEKTALVFGYHVHIYSYPCTHSEQHYTIGKSSWTEIHLLCFLMNSAKALRQERRMLSEQMMKKFSEQQREKLFVEWGIGLNTKLRRLQLAQRLWSKTEDINHIADSAILVAKLVGFIESGQAPNKEMFGINFTPKCSTGICTYKRSLGSLLWCSWVYTIICGYIYIYIHTYGSVVRLTSSLSSDIFLCIPL